MAKASDLMGRSGSSGFHSDESSKLTPHQTEKKVDTKDHSATKKKPNRDAGPIKGGSNVGGGGAPTSVRPKV